MVELDLEPKRCLWSTLQLQSLLVRPSVGSVESVVGNGAAVPQKNKAKSYGVLRLGEIGPNFF